MQQFFVDKMFDNQKCSLFAACNMQRNGRVQQKKSKKRNQGCGPSSRTASSMNDFKTNSPLFHDWSNNKIWISFALHKCIDIKYISPNHRNDRTEIDWIELIWIAVILTCIFGLVQCRRPPIPVDLYRHVSMIAGCFWFLLLCCEDGALKYKTFQHYLSVVHFEYLDFCFDSGLRVGLCKNHYIVYHSPSLKIPLGFWQEHFPDADCPEEKGHGMLWNVMHCCFWIQGAVFKL